jgi:hypothetical protein
MHKAWAILPIQIEFHWVINSLKPPSDWANSGAANKHAEILADALKRAACYPPRAYSGT